MPTFSIKPSDIPSSPKDSRSFRLLAEDKKKDFNFPFGGVNNKDLVFFTREFSILLNAGVPIVESLNILEKQLKNKRFRKIVSDLARSIESGSSLSASLSRHPHTFNNLFISLVKTGEISGSLDQALNFIADQQEKDYMLKRRIKGALAYPLFIICAMVAVLALLFIFVMPKMLDMLAETGARLPVTTKILIFTTNFMAQFWWVGVLILVLGYATFHFIVSKPTGKLWWHRTRLKLPVIGSLVQKTNIEYFARNFAVLVKGGVPVVTGLEVTADTMGNYAYKQVLLTVAKDVENGRPLAESLSEHPEEIPPLVSQMVSVGEQTSKIDEILFKVALFYEREVDQSVGTMTQMLEPAVMLILGAVVAVIVSGILLPIYNLVSVQ